MVSALAITPHSFTDHRKDLLLQCFNNQKKFITRTEADDLASMMDGVTPE